MANSTIYLQLLGERPVHKNQSRIQVFHNCHRKYGWEYFHKLIPQRPRWALNIGTAVHLGLAALGSNKTPAEAADIAENELRRLTPRALVPGDDADLFDNIELVRRMIVAYHDEYEGKTTWVPIAQETKGCVEVGEGTNAFLVFRTDKLATWFKRLWIVDHKTAGRNDPRDLLKYDMALQFTSYIYGMTKHLKQRVAGVIVDVLVKTKFPQFVRDMKTRTDAELLEFEGEFVEVAREIEWREERVRLGEDFRTVFYKNTDECFRYGTCPYRELCLEDNPTRRELYNVREDDYVDDQHRPIDSIEKGA